VRVHDPGLLSDPEDSASSRSALAGSASIL
jgi:hypothetical protein